MAEDDGPLHVLARAILDNQPVDWARSESEADASARQILNELKVIAGIARAHGSVPSSLEECADPPPEGATEAPLQSWGSLRLLERVGAGAYGEVFRAWDTRLDREVALKLLEPTHGFAGKIGSSIIEEGRSLARVRHPNVAMIYGAEQIDDRVGLWMEFVRGRTMEEIIADAPLDAFRAARIGVDICRAVSAVHGAGLLHRDIKAQNVMLADDGRVVLMDFGAVRALEDEPSTDLAGTPLYLAPEILRGEPATIQSDVYSLGVLLYRLVSSSYPVLAATTGELRRSHERGARVPLDAVRPEVPSAFARIVARATDPVPGRRYRTAEALANDLAAAGRHSWRLVALYVALATATLGLISWLPAERADRAPESAGRRPVIAVLPFMDLGRRPGSAELADGLTAEIHRNIAVIDGLDLRSYTSSFSLGEKPRIADAGRQLGADYILEGSVFQAEGTVRITARLVRVVDDTTVWAGKYDRPASAIFAIHDEISLAIVNALRLKLGRGQRRYEPAPDIYAEFLRAQGLRSRRSPENAARAAATFEAIVARDPFFAPAWAGLASATADATRHEAREAMPPVDPRMEPAARRAIDLDPLLAEAHAAMGSVYGRNRDWANARKSFETALDLNPSLTTTYTDFVLSTLMPMGRNAECLERLEAARRVDPLSLDVHRLLAQVQVNAGRHEEAIESARWVLARDPKFPYAEVFLGRALLFAGRPDEALPLLENSTSEGNWGYVGYLYAVSGRRLEAEALAAEHPDAAARQMMIYSGLGDRDRAFEALERTAAVNWWRAATWMIRPEMAVLHADPRVADLRRRLGLPPFEEAR